MRPWGPEDRLTRQAVSELLERLPQDDDESVRIEIEIWPTANTNDRARWRDETEVRIRELGGRIIDRSSIAGTGFNYEAVLAELAAGDVRQIIENPADAGSLAALDGIQFILPQTIAQALPIDGDDDDAESDETSDFDDQAPFRVALLDGTPIAAHPVLDGGVAVEDINGLVERSEVRHRRHATSMASLILRGDLQSDGAPLTDTRLVSIPVLIDAEASTVSPDDRLFVDLIHVALTRLIEGDDPIAPDVFVVNFSIGMRNGNFLGRVSALARLMDWWSATRGVLFVVSSGNVSPTITIQDMHALQFEDANSDEQRAAVRGALRETIHERTLLSPSEALNALTVGGRVNGPIAANRRYSEGRCTTP